MTWTYSGNPASSNRDAVRFEIGDTIAQKKLVENEEIDYLLTEESNNILLCAARICEALAVRFAREATIRTSTFTKDKTSISDRYLKLAAALRKRAGVSTGALGGFVCPSISIAEKEAIEDDTDIPLPFAKRGLHDNPNGSATSKEDV